MYLDPDCRDVDDDELVTDPMGEEETLIIDGFDFTDDGLDYAEEPED